MTPTREELLEMGRLQADVFADRIFAALPDDPDCHESFRKWREIHRRVFIGTERIPKSVYDDETEAFKTLMAELQFAGVTKF